MQVQGINSYNFNYNNPNFTAKKSEENNPKENKSLKRSLVEKLSGPAVAAMFLVPAATTTLPSCESYININTKTNVTIPVDIPIVVPKDTVYITDTDTIYVPTTDTIYVDNTDTIYVPSVDTVFVPTTDTIYVPQTDTIYTEKTDTIYVPETDTIYVPTTDTIYISNTDTIYVPKTDTVYVPTTDTIFINNTDTIYVPTTDTIYVPKTDTIHTTDTVQNYDTIYVKDTIYVPTENFEFPREIHDSLNYWRKGILDVGAKGDDEILEGKALLYASATRDWYNKQPEYIKMNLDKSDNTEARFDHVIGNEIENDIRITLVKPGEITVVKKDGTTTDQVSGLLFNEDGVKTFAHSVNGEKIILYKKEMDGDNYGKYVELGSVEPGYLPISKYGQNILLNGILSEGTEDHYTNVNAEVMEVDDLEQMAGKY